MPRGERDGPSRAVPSTTRVGIYQQRHLTYMSRPPRRGRRPARENTTRASTVSGCGECCSSTQASTTTGLSTSSLNRDAPLLEDGQGICTSPVHRLARAAPAVVARLLAAIRTRVRPRRPPDRARRSAHDLPRAHLRAPGRQNPNPTATSQSALALWDYAARSASWALGHTTSDPLAEQIHAAHCCTRHARPPAPGWRCG